MEQDRPLYGELVVASGYEREEHNPPTDELEHRAHSMIREAAYYLAEKRGFAPGQELEDWLKAKAQILKQYL
jgi:hypothetical protein